MIDRAFLRRCPAAWSVSPISRSRLARRPVIERLFTGSVALSCPARSGRFVEPDQADATCPVPLRENIPVPFRRKSPAYPPPSRPDTEGRFAIVTDVGCGMRWTRAALLTRAPPCGRRSRVVLTPRRWRQVLEKQASCKFLGGDGGKQARSPGRARNKPLKPLRAGMPGDPGATVVTNSCVYYFYTRGCGCNGHPAFPTPFVGRIDDAQLGRMARRDAKLYVHVIARSEATKQSILTSRLHGLLRFARNDDLKLAMTISRRLARWLFENRIGKWSTRFRPSSAAPADGSPPATERSFAT